MGRGAGVEVRGNSIRLFFVDQHGQRHRETLKVNGKALSASSPNLAFAARLAERIRKEVELGVFNLSEHFPSSRKAQAGNAAQFGALADQWLESKGHLSGATKSQYRLACGVWKRLLGSTTPLDRLTHAKLAATIGGHPWASAKLRNNYLIALRGILGLHYRGKLALENPLADIKNARVARKLPDPLTMAERDAILADMGAHYDTRIVSYFLVAFFTGMRPEELIALRWADIDWGAHTIRVQRVRTFKGSEREEVKTGTGRDVDMVPWVAQALQAMKPYTFMKRDDAGQPVDVFENPVTGKPWHDERSQRDHYWKPALKRLGIRERRAYCTRHTYCTAALMAGLPPAYIAAQAGHSVKMLLDVYARWIPGADTGARDRLAAALQSTQRVPIGEVTG